MNILIICGSLRKQSYTRILTDLVFQYAKENFPAAIVRYLDLLNHPVEQFKGFEENYSHKTKEAIELVSSADCLIIGTPVYDGLLSSGIKNLFEHITQKALENKVAGFVIHSAGPISSLQVQGQLVALMNYFRVISNPRAVFTYRDQHFDKERVVLKDESVKKRLHRLVEETVGLAGELKGG